MANLEGGYRKGMGVLRGTNMRKFYHEDNIPKEVEYSVRKLHGKFRGANLKKLLEDVEDEWEVQLPPFVMGSGDAP